MQESTYSQDETGDHENALCKLSSILTEDVCIELADIGMIENLTEFKVNLSQVIENIRVEIREEENGLLGFLEI